MSSHAEDVRPRAVVFGCGGSALTPEEKAFFAETDPAGFILFERNCETPAQARALVAALRDAVGRRDAPVLIDQEGGRVARLRPPHWRAAPPARAFGELARRDPAAGAEAARLNGRLIAAELGELGITVDCAPVLDVPVPDAHDVIGDRAFGTEAPVVARLSRAFADALIAGGVLPLIKHIPGHGRAVVDSHAELPRVAAPLSLLRATDFVPFKGLADAPWAMTAHVLYEAVDDRPATQSRRVIEEVIRGEIGFEGVLISDDLSMEALDGGLGDRAAAALAAGCDLVLHSSGALAEMEEVVAGAGPLSEAAARRCTRARNRLREPEAVDAEAVRSRLEALLSGGVAA
ncbi:MAG: beta-N-acetylhexosaminidase [Alphaproteobacteria bacterium]